MDYTSIIGIVAGTLTTVAFIPQVIKIWKLKETRDLSLTTFLLWFIGINIWLMYGIIRKDVVIITANAVTIILGAIILYFKFKYK
jgi:MtN3 and saliva related transmembrane protein